MSKLIDVNLKDLKESPSNPRKSFDDVDMQELSTSIKEVGILQPLVIMPNGKGYEIVCGHRRYRAAKLAKLESVPAVLREDLTPEQSLELQIIENLQRKDVHPLDEAIAFKRLQEERKFSIEEVAGRVGKSERFVVQRLKLNDLIDDIQQPFYANKINLTQAFKIARMTEKDQSALYTDSLKGWKKDNFYIGNIDHYISRSMLGLKSAAFDLSSKELVKSAGPCISCVKNTACSVNLFPNNQEEAKCTDRSCFDLKSEKHLANTIENMEAAGVDFYLLYNDYSDSTLPEKYKARGYKLLMEYNDFRETEIKKGSKTGLYINSRDCGKEVKIILTESRNAKSATDGDDPQVQIANIKAREKRAKELDAEKVYLAVFQHFTSTEEPKNFQNNRSDLNKYECVALATALVRGLPHHSRHALFSELYEASYFDYSLECYDQLFQNLDKGKLNQLLRIFTIGILDHYKGQSHEQSPYGKAIFEMAQDQMPTEVAKIDFAQREIRGKREERVAKRIEKIEADVAKAAAEKKPPKKKVEKAKKSKEAVA